MAKIKGQLESAQLENLTTDPANLPEGRAWVNTTGSRAKVVVGSSTQTVVTEAQTQTLTNKTLTNPTVTTGTFTAPAISDPTLTKDTFALGIPALSATADVLTNNSTQVVTNKDIDGGTASNTRRITLPKETTAALAALTRKQGTLAYDTTQGKVVYDDGTTLTAVGSGAGGSINFIDNGDAELTTAIFSGYTSGTVGARPAGTQTAGAANLTFTRSTTNPLYKSASWVISKSATNAQGQNGSIPFTVDPAFRGKAIQITIDDIVDSGTFVAGSSTTDSDVIVYIYDVTNSTFIEPSNFKFLSNSTTLAERFTANFQTSSNGSSYRLVFHVATTSAVVWALKVDNISVSPLTYVYGTPITDEVTYTPTLSGFGNVTNNTMQGRRNGQFYECSGAFTAGTTGAPAAYVTLPNGLSIDFSKYTRKRIVGKWGAGTTTSTFVKQMMVDPTQPNIVYFTAHSAANADLTSQSGSSILNNSADAAYEFKVPIVGWSSSVQMSDTTDTRVIAANIYRSSAQSFTNGATIKVNLDSVGTDKSGMFDVANNRVLIRVAGTYEVFGQVTFATNSTNDRIGAIYKNGVDVVNASMKASSSIQTTIPVKTTLDLISGDYIELHALQNSGSTINVNGASNLTFLTVTRISGPSAIAATERVYASYYCSTNVSSSTTQPINFDTKDSAISDSHGAVSTGASWKFTAPTSGVYDIYGFLANTAGVTIVLQIYKNGSVDKPIAYISGGAAFPVAFSNSIMLNAGDYIDLRNTSGTQTIGGGSRTSAGTTSNITIKKVGL